MFLALALELNQVVACLGRVEQFCVMHSVSSMLHVKQQRLAGVRRDICKSAPKRQGTDLPADDFKLQIAVSGHRRVQAQVVTINDHQPGGARSRQA